MIKVKNVDKKSALRKLVLPVTSISSCDTQRVFCPVQGSVHSIQFITTAAVISGMHWTVKTLVNSATLLDFCKTLTTVASAAIIAVGNGTEFSAGSPLEINTSSTANFAPATVVVVIAISDKEK